MTPSCSVSWKRTEHHSFKVDNLTLDQQPDAVMDIFRVYPLKTYTYTESDHGPNPKALRVSESIPGIRFVTACIFRRYHTHESVAYIFPLYIVTPKIIGLDTNRIQFSTFM